VFDYLLRVKERYDALPTEERIAVEPVQKHFLLLSDEVSHALQENGYLQKQ
jgi:hypothetical protein